MEEKRSSLGLITTIKESKDKNNSFITVGVTFAIIVLLIVFAIRPTVTKIVIIRKDIKEKERISQTLDQRIQMISSLEKEYDESKEKFEFLQFVYRESEKYILLLSNIEPIVNRNSFKLTSFRFDKYDGDSYDLPTSLVKPGVIQLSVTGLYSNFINLLKDFESLPMNCVIERVAFGRNTSSGSNEMSFSLLIRIYNIPSTNFYNIE